MKNVISYNQIAQMNSATVPSEYMPLQVSIFKKPTAKQPKVCCEPKEHKHKKHVFRYPTPVMSGGHRKGLKHVF